MIKHLHFVRKRLASGVTRWYVYASRGGPQLMWADQPRKPHLTAEAILLLAGAADPKRMPGTPLKTLGDLISRWQSSPAWAGYSANTKKTWSAYARVIESKWGNSPLGMFDDRRMVAEIVDWQEGNSDRPRSADLGVDVLKAVLRHGVRCGVLTINVAAGVGKIYEGGQREEIIWTEAELAAFEAKAIELDMEPAALALRLCAVTGLRRQDLVTLTWAHVQEFAIVKKALKSSRKKRRFATVPRIPELENLLRRLREMPRTDGVETLLVVDGRPWKLDELTKAIAVIRNAAGGVYHIDPDTGQKRQKHLHDARGTFATKLMKADLTDEEIGDIMGWSRDEVARIRAVYVDRTAYHMALGRRIAEKL